MFRLRCHRLGVATERRHDRVPREDGAFDARRKLVHAGEHGQLADVALDIAGHHHFVDLAKHFFHVGLGFALGKFREQRRRGLGNAAARTDKADVLDGVAVQREKQFQLVATKRVVALGGAGRLRHFVEIPRLFAVVENDLLVKVVDVVKHGQ